MPPPTLVVRVVYVSPQGAVVPAPDEELQFALLFVVPRKVSEPARLESGIKYCLEWFEAVTDVPSFDGQGDGGGSDVGF